MSDKPVANRIPNDIADCQGEFCIFPDYSLESMVRRFVKVPVPAYKPKKSGEDDPAILPILERGMRYIDEFAQPEGKEKESDGAGA